MSLENFKNIPEDKLREFELKLDKLHKQDYERQMTIMLNLTKNSKEYWEQRCIQLEISIDPTYNPKARANAREFYKTLVNL